MSDYSGPPYLSIAFLKETKAVMHKKLGGPPPYDFVFRGMWSVEPGPLLANGVVIGIRGSDGEICAMDYWKWLHDDDYGTEAEKKALEDDEIEFMRSMGTIDQ